MNSTSFASNSSFPLPGDVVDATATGAPWNMEFWPKLREEVLGWKFKPFEKDGKAVTAEVEEFLDLVPPERLPAKHVVPPVLRPDSEGSRSH